MIAVEPEHRARQEEAAHLVSAVVEDVTVPVGVEPLTGIGVFVKVRPVEERQPVFVGREVRGNPVQNHADAALMQVVDEVHQVLR